MKRTFSFLLAGMLAVLGIPPAHAETGPVSIQELPGMTSPVWKQTYEACGRTIDIDVAIDIPDVEKAPVIRVRTADPLPEPERSEMIREYKEKNKKAKKAYYEFGSDDYETIRLEEAYPLLWGTSKKNDNYSPAVTQDEYDLPRYDPDQAYAENTDLTVRQAWEILDSHLRDLVPGTETKLDRVIVNGKTYRKRNGKTVFDKGSYTLELCQCFHGIPVKAFIRKAYCNELRNRDENVDWFSYSYGRGAASGDVFSDDSYLLVAWLYKETGTVCEDIPLLPFDAVKDQVEALIMSGHVRWINSITLGYVQFDTEDPQEQILLPCWVVWCEYHPEGAKSEKEYGINDSPLMFDGNNYYYRPLVINAQTGKLFDPESTAENRAMCPDLSAWR